MRGRLLLLGAGEEATMLGEAIAFEADEEDTMLGADEAATRRDMQQGDAPGA